MGANFVWLVRILMIVCYPIAYPVGKVISTTNSCNSAGFKFSDQVLSKAAIDGNYCALLTCCDLVSS